MLLRSCLDDLSDLLVSQLLHLRQSIHLTQQPVLLAGSSHYDTAIRNLVSPLHQHLVLSRAYLARNLLDSRIDWSTGKGDDRCQRSVTGNLDTFRVAVVDDGLGFGVDVRMKFDLSIPGRR